MRIVSNFLRKKLEKIPIFPNLIKNRFHHKWLLFEDFPRKKIFMTQFRWKLTIFVRKRKTRFCPFGNGKTLKPTAIIRNEHELEHFRIFVPFGKMKLLRKNRRKIISSKTTKILGIDAFHTVFFSMEFFYLTFKFWTRPQNDLQRSTEPLLPSKMVNEVVTTILAFTLLACESGLKLPS